MPKRIVQETAPVLRKVAEEVPAADIKSAKVAKVLADMKAALATQDDGVAIAAPQIDVPLRIFIVSGRILSAIRHEEGLADEVYINPVLTKLSREKAAMEEGCLSVRNKYGKVRRSKKATVEAYDEHGAKFVRGGSGLLAQIFQHETDHLDGILFIDKAKDVFDLEPGDEGFHSLD
jgi:peptide deformylase